MINLNLGKDKDNTKLPVCPFGATCYRKNLLHFAQYSHPFDLLNPDRDSSDEDESQKKNEIVNKGKKRKIENDDDDDGEKTEEYDTDDVSFPSINEILL